MVTAPARREVVREMVVRGLSERRALRIVRMSASSRRYTPARDRNTALRAQIVALAHRHRRYGAGMIYLKLRQAGERVNHKRVDRIYTAERLQIRRRRRKKVPVADRQPRCGLSGPTRCGPPTSCLITPRAASSSVWRWWTMRPQKRWRSSRPGESSPSFCVACRIADATVRRCPWSS